tara:strand:+ start:8632 stop:9390 length:759 start_codon:yes stop_codon:yes gene_type:complete
MIGLALNKAREALNKLINKLKHSPPRVRKFIDKNGEEKIVKIEAVRTPIHPVLGKFLNAISLGTFKKLQAKTGYDKLMHLKLVLTTASGKQFVWEKNGSVNIGGKFKSTSKDERSPVDMNGKTPTLAQMVEKTKARMGDDFGRYDAFKNNCQDFLINTLKANGLGNSIIYDWIKQDISQIAEGLPRYVKGTARSVTDLGAVAELFPQLLGLEEGGVTQARIGNKRMRSEDPAVLGRIALAQRQRIEARLYER